jgi:hypothetical protein
MENSVDRAPFLWLALLVWHFVIAAVGGMFIGFLPEALVSRIYYNTGFEPYSPAIATSAFLLGYFVSYRFLSARVAIWTWAIGVAWLVVGVYELTSHWSASWSPEKTRWGYAIANLFGSTLKCSGSECLYEVFFTTPFAASVLYSIGAFLRKRQLSTAPVQQIK